MNFEEIIKPPSGFELLSYKYYSEEEIRNKLREIYNKRMGNWEKFGVSGFITEWEAIYRYRGVEFVIKCLKYFSFNFADPLKAVGINKIGRHLVLEYTEKSSEIHDIARELGREDFLWEDTLHCGMEDWDIDEMIEYLFNVAKDDIDWLLDRALSECEEKISKLKKILSSLTGD